MSFFKHMTYYKNIHGESFIATTQSVPSQKQQYVYAEKDGNRLKECVIGWLYYIDDNEVSFEVYKRIVNWIDEYRKIEEANNVKPYDEQYIDSCIESIINAPIRSIFDEIKNHKEPRNPWGAYIKSHTITNNTKGEFKMPKIKNYKYIAEHGVTIIDWTDGTTTKVVCDSAKADQFTGFTAAIAKKAMGNGGKMLNEWDRLVVEPIEKVKKAEEKAKVEAEKKAEEEKIHAEAKAKREAKKAKRMKQKLIEEMAKDFADSYNMGELRDAALKLATEKYGVPKGYFDLHYGCDEDCCKEFDTLVDNKKE